jgi:O-antigen ligase
MAKKPTVDWVYAFVLIAFGFTVLGFLVVEFSETIINQFTRNTQKVDLSGREKIWAQYIDQILSNPWFGNASHKVWFKYHAHNSFLQLIATNGIIISIFYFGFIVTHARRNNLIYLAVMMVYSFFQYGIFWGISIIDIVFYVFLLKAAEREGTRFFSISP